MVLDFALRFFMNVRSTRMAHVKVINASRGPIHRYEKLNRELRNCYANLS